MDTTEQPRVMRKLNPKDAEWLPKVMQLISVRTETRQSVFRDLSTQQHSKTTEMVHQKGKTNKIRQWKKRAKHQIPQGCWLLALIKVGKVGMEKRALSHKGQKDGSS